MLYATNGHVQDLPENTQFLFWGQEDFGRAFKIAKLMLAAKHGRLERDNYNDLKLTEHGSAYMLEWSIHMLLDAISQDPCKAFVSRPSDQNVDWVQWGQFCQWFFVWLDDLFSFDKIIGDIKWGHCGRWLGQFLAREQVMSGHNWTFMFPHCCKSNASVDQMVFWDIVDFNVSRCKSEAMPEPKDIPSPQSTLEYLADLYLSLPEAKHFTAKAHKTYNASEHAAIASAQSPSPVDVKQLDEVTQVASEKKDGSIAKWLLVVGAVVLGASVLVVSASGDD